MLTPTNLLAFNRQSMEAYFKDIGAKPYHARYLLKSIYQQGISNFSDMQSLDKNLRNKLSTVAFIKAPKILSTQISRDGTHKWLMQVDDNNSIETVLIPEKKRTTLCVSSQVGCALNCSFCATGKQGFSRNLSTAEIIGQLWRAQHALGVYQNKHLMISNVVFMGMGEPMLNFNNVIDAISLMTEDHTFGISHKRITLSTSGLVTAIDKLAGVSNVNLAILLHAASNKLRDELMPINKSFPLEVLFAACRRYVRRHTKSIIFEYVMLDDVNDSEAADAYMLVELIKGIAAKINLIPFNPVAGTGYRCSSTLKMNRFRDILISNGLFTIIRKNRGRDIDAACGQLAGKIISRSARYSTSAIH